MDPQSDPRFVLVVHFSARRRCSNMCGHLERRGLDVVCADGIEDVQKIVARTAPEAVVVRADDARLSNKHVQNELRSVQEACRTSDPDVPVFLWRPSRLNQAELPFISAFSIPVVHNYPELEEALSRVLGR